MNAGGAITCVFGGSFVIMFIMLILAIHDRDTTRRAIIEADGATITVTCKEPSHDQ